MTWTIFVIAFGVSLPVSFLMLRSAMSSLAERRRQAEAALAKAESDHHVTLACCGKDAPSGRERAPEDGVAGEVGGVLGAAIGGKIRGLDGAQYGMDIGKEVFRGLVAGGASLLNRLSMSSAEREMMRAIEHSQGRVDAALAALRTLKSNGTWLQVARFVLIPAALASATCIVVDQVVPAMRQVLIDKASLEDRAPKSPATFVQSTNEAFERARKGCDGGKMSACAEVGDIATRKDFAVAGVCLVVFSAIAASCRAAPSRNRCFGPILVPLCRNVAMSADQEHALEFGHCVLGGKTRTECEGKEDARTRASAAATGGDGLRPGITWTEFLASAAGTTISRNPSADETRSCGTVARYLTTGGDVQYTFFAGRLVEIRHYREIEIGPFIDDADRDRRAMADHMKPTCGAAVVRSVWIDDDAGHTDLRCNVTKVEGHGAAVEVRGDQQLKLMQVADFVFEPNLETERARCFPRPIRVGDEEP